MTRVLFIADKFSDAQRTRKERHPGGAELTDEAAIQACPWPVTAMTCAALQRSEPSLLDGFDVIVVANSETARPELLERVARTRRHVVFEHDLRICRWRGNFPMARDARHRWQQACWCPHLEQRELFGLARGVIFLTGMQERYYRGNCHFACVESRVLGSSLFSPSVLEVPRAPPGERHGSCVFASPQLIKGHRRALEYCRQRGITPEPIQNLSPQGVLGVFARSERFVYLPIGPEWAGRMVVEARLLGCEVVLSDLVGVAGEPFWRLERDAALAFLLDGPKRFWRLVEELMNGPSVHAVRPVSAPERALSGLSWTLRKLPFRFLAVGAPHGTLPEPRTYAAW
jgi:hypothetical protein